MGKRSMFKYLVRRASGTTYYIDAHDFLFLVQRHVNAAPLDEAQGAGTQTSPWRLTTAPQWLGCAKKLPKSTENYLIAAGRLIKRGSNQYISDEGPAWRSGHEGALPVTPQGDFEGQTIPGPTTGPAPAAMKAFQGKAPTYREAAEQVVDPNRILPEADARRKSADLAGAETWADVRKQPMLRRAIRSILKGEQLEWRVGGKVVKDYSRMQTALPVLTVAMFLAETARNSRAFPVNLMLLDLAEGWPGSFMLDRILWHPDALIVNKKLVEWLDLHDPLSGEETGPASMKNRTIGPITRRSDLHLVGGIMPASPTGGGVFGKRAVPVSTHQKPKPKFSRDFIHDKEASVVVKWLEWATFSAWQAVTEVQEDWFQVPYNSVVFPDHPKKGFERIQGDLMRFDTLIDNRCKHLDPGR
jgi:hypothetical protein